MEASDMGALITADRLLIFRIRKCTWGYQEHQEHEKPLDDLDGYRSGEWWGYRIRIFK